MSNNPHGRQDSSSTTSGDVSSSSLSSSINLPSLEGSERGHQSPQEEPSTCASVYKAAVHTTGIRQDAVRSRASPVKLRFIRSSISNSNSSGTTATTAAAVTSPSRIPVPNPGIMRSVSAPERHDGNDEHDHDDAVQMASYPATMPASPLTAATMPMPRSSRSKTLDHPPPARLLSPVMQASSSSSLQLPNQHYSSSSSSSGLRKPHASTAPSSAVLGGVPSPTVPIAHDQRLTSHQDRSRSNSTSIIAISHASHAFTTHAPPPQRATLPHSSSTSSLLLSSKAASPVAAVPASPSPSTHSISSPFIYKRHHTQGSSSYTTPPLQQREDSTSTASPRLSPNTPLYSHVQAHANTNTNKSGDANTAGLVPSYGSNSAIAPTAPQAAESAGGDEESEETDQEVPSPYSPAFLSALSSPAAAAAGDFTANSASSPSTSFAYQQQQSQFQGQGQRHVLGSAVPSPLGPRQQYKHPQQSPVVARYQHKQPQGGKGVTEGAEEEILAAISSSSGGFGSSPYNYTSSSSSSPGDSYHLGETPGLLGGNSGYSYTRAPKSSHAVFPAPLAAATTSRRSNSVSSYTSNSDYSVMSMGRSTSFDAGAGNAVGGVGDGKQISPHGQDKNGGSAGYLHDRSISLSSDMSTDSIASPRGREIDGSPGIEHNASFLNLRNTPISTPRAQKKSLDTRTQHTTPTQDATTTPSSSSTAADTPSSIMNETPRPGVSADRAKKASLALKAAMEGGFTTSSTSAVSAEENETQARMDDRRRVDNSSSSKSNHHHQQQQPSPGSQEGRLGRLPTSGTLRDLRDISSIDAQTPPSLSSIITAAPESDAGAATGRKLKSDVSLSNIHIRHGSSTTTKASTSAGAGFGAEGSASLLSASRLQPPPPPDKLREHPSSSSSSSHSPRAMKGSKNRGKEREKQRDRLYSSGSYSSASRDVKMPTVPGMEEDDAQTGVREKDSSAAVVHVMAKKKQSGAKKTTWTLSQPLWYKAPVWGRLPTRGMRAHSATVVPETLPSFLSSSSSSRNASSYSSSIITTELFALDPSPGPSSSLYIFGGCDAKTCFKDLYKLDLDSFQWSKPRTISASPHENSSSSSSSKSTSAAPPPLRAHSMTFIPPFMSTGDTPYDKADERILRKKSKEGHLLLFGGGDGPNYFNDLYLLNLTTMTWSRPLPAPTSEIESSSNSQGVGLAPQQYMYGSIPSPRRAHTALWYDKRKELIVFGGGNGSKALNETWILECKDWMKLTWRKVDALGKLPRVRGYHTMNLLGDRAIIFGGSDGSECFSDVFVLDLDTFTWTEIPIYEPSLHCPRLSHSATMISPTQLLILGGHNGTDYKRDITIFSLSTGKFYNINNAVSISPSGSGVGPSRRGYHTACLIDGKVVMLGGFDGKRHFEEVWCLEVAAIAACAE